MGEPDRSINNGNKVDGSEVKDSEVKKKVSNLFKSKKAVGSDIFTLGAQLTFNKLGLTFVKASILYQFDPKHHIRI